MIIWLLQKHIWPNLFSFSSQGFHLSHDLPESVKWQPSQLVDLLLLLMTTTEVRSLGRYSKCTINSWCYTENLPYKTVSSQGALALHPVAAHVAVQSTVGRLFHIIQVSCFLFQSLFKPLPKSIFYCNSFDKLHALCNHLYSHHPHQLFSNGCPSDCFV